MESKKSYKSVYMQSRNRLTDIGSKLVTTEGRNKWEGANSGYGIKRYKLLSIKQIINKDILYSTGN